MITAEQKDIIDIYVNFFNKYWKSLNSHEEINSDFVISILKDTKKSRWPIPFSSSHSYKNVLIIYDDNRSLMIYFFQIFIHLMTHRRYGLSSDDNFKVITSGDIYSEYFNTKNILSRNKELVIYKIPIIDSSLTNPLYKESIEFFYDSMSCPLWAIAKTQHNTIEKLPCKLRDFILSIPRVTMTDTY